MNGRGLARGRLRLTCGEGWDWAPWDCEHTKSGAKLEIKQAAARQSWDREPTARRRNPAFDIAPCKGYFPKDGGPRVESPGWQADTYVFAWHGRQDKDADQRDVGQWSFLVVAERDLPAHDGRIGLSKLEEIVAPCGIADLRQAVERAQRAPDLVPID